MFLDSLIRSKITERLSESDSPFYLYDTSRIVSKCQQFKQIPYPLTSIHFASMANANPNILKLIKTEGISIFVNSIIHLEIAKEVGFLSDSIVFTASGLNKEIMRHIQKENIQVNLDSLGQLRQWEELFGNSQIGLRCNIDDQINPKKTHAGYFVGKESRLGLTRDELESLRNNPRIRGLHLYVGTDIMDIEYFLRYYESLSEMIDLFPNLEYLNFGGGFGVNENGEHSFPIFEYGLRVADLMQRVCRDQNREIRLILEPGRIITCDSGYFICKVTDIKERGSKLFIGVNASSVQFPRPLMYPEIAKHPLVALRDGEQIASSPAITGSVYGCSTYSRDFLVSDAKLPLLQIGDTLVFGNAGAYSASSYTEFLGFPKPPEFFV